MLGRMAGYVGEEKLECMGTLGWVTGNVRGGGGEMLCRIRGRWEGSTSVIKIDFYIHPPNNIEAEYDMAYL